MKNRNEIIEKYLELSRKVQKAGADFEVGVSDLSKLLEITDEFIQYSDDNDITRQELTDYQDSKRNVTKVDNVKDAFAAMQKAFS